MSIKIVGGVTVPGGSAPTTFSLNSPPVWSTAAGSLGSVLEPDTITSQGFTVTATDVNVNDTVEYSLYAGTLPTGSAFGTITFTGQPNNNDTVVLNGVTWTFVTAGATGNQTNIGADLEDTLSNLVVDVNASVDGSLTVSTYTASATVFSITYDNTSAAGNSVTLAAGTDTAGVQTASGATLSGGNVTASLNSSTGDITGGLLHVVTSTIFTFTVEATDGKLITRREFSIQINDGDDPIWRTPTGSLGGIYLGDEAVSETIVAIDVDGDPSDIAYSVIAGSFPATLDWDDVPGGPSLTGVISGTAVAGSTSTFTVEATDSLNTNSRSFTIRVNAPPVFTTSGDIGSVQEGASDSFQVTATTGVDLLTQVISYALQSGSLPIGYALNTGSGAITGTAGSVGSNTTYNFTIRASDGLETTDQAHSITIINNIVPVWVTPQGNLGSIYLGDDAVSETVLATDADGEPMALEYSVTVGSFPTGLDWDDVPGGPSLTGVISGTAEADSTATFTVQATDSVDSVTRSFTIRVNNPPIFTTSGAIGSVQEGASDSFQVTANHGDTIDLGQSVTYALQSGSLPTGYALNTGSGAITGTAGSVGSNTTYNFTIRASDGLETTDQAHSIDIINNIAPAWVTAAGTFATAADEGVGGSTYTITATDADDAPASIVYTIETGSVPAGMSLDSVSGIISGTPTDGSFNDDVLQAFTARASDTLDNPSDRAFNIKVNCATFEDGVGTSATGRSQLNATGLANNINLIYGVGTGNSGYGQTPITLPTGNTEVSDTLLLAWRDAVSDCATHQGITLNPALVSTALITGGKPWSAETYFNELTVNTNAGTVDISDDPTLVDSGSVTVTGDPNSVSQSRGASWVTTVDHIFTVTFSSQDHARAFFNAGGQIRLAASRSGGSATNQNTSWTNLLSGAGTVLFEASDYFAVTTTYVSLANFIGSGAYAANDWDISVKTNTVVDGTGRGGKGSVLTFRSQYNDDHVGIGGGPDNIDGTLTSDIDMRNVDGTPLTITAPTFATTNSL